jgi:peptide/nickel transport system substrate-binding protein
VFDFDWVNKNLYYGAFVRAAGYFNDSELSAVGKPANDKEKALLAPYPGTVDDDVMNGTYQPVSAGGADGGRAAMRDALEQLQAAGYELKGNRLVNTGTGQPLTFEIMVVNNEDEKLALAYERTLARIGISVSVRNVEDAQFQPRLQQYDYDMVRRLWGASLSPGNEQLGRWSQAAADRPSSFNYAGAREPAIDAMIAAMLAARSREDFVAAVRALDRLLISGYYVVPLFYLPDQWVAYWNTLGHPGETSLTGYVLPTWWRKPVD